MKLSKIIIALLIVSALLAWGGTAFFIVETSQSAILARFNRPLEHVYQPGLHFKAPWPIGRGVLSCVARGPAQAGVVSPP